MPGAFLLCRARAAKPQGRAAGKRRGYRTCSITGSAQKQKPPPKRGFQIRGARTRTKMPGAFLLCRARAANPQGRAAGMRRGYRTCSMTGSAQKQKPSHKAGFFNSWCPNPESNQGHGDFQSPALPTELFGQRGALNRNGRFASTPFR